MQSSNDICILITRILLHQEHSVFHCNHCLGPKMFSVLIKLFSYCNKQLINRSVIAILLITGS